MQCSLNLGVLDMSRVRVIAHSLIVCDVLVYITVCLYVFICQ